MDKALGGIRVLDFARYIAGPYCGMVLADMGAEVIRVEQPGGADDRELGPFTPDGTPLAFGITIPRNKKGITLNLRTEKGKGILKELVKHSDVVLENFGPGTKEEMGFDYEVLSKVNPRIVLVSVSAFGNSGPYSNRVAFDHIMQAMCGAMSFSGFPDRPPLRAAVSYVDFSSALYAALGTMFALFHRERTGRGQAVDIALFDVAFSFIASLGVAAEYLLLGQTRPRIGNAGFYSFSNSFPTRDGAVFVGVVGSNLWRRFVKVIGHGEWASNPRFKDDMARYINREAIIPSVSEWTTQRSTDEVIRLLEEARVPCGRVNSIAEAVAEPQVRAREMLVELDYPGVGKVPLSGVVPKLSATPGRVETRAPLVGEHNEEVYCGLLGFTPEQLRELEQEGVI